MFRATARMVLQRELAGVRRTVDAYPDDASVWATKPGLPNAGGTLVLHLAGNLQHYLGAVLGHSGYQRDRAAEFSRRDVPRAALLAEIDAADRAIARGIDATSDDALDTPYPELIAGRTVMTGDFLLHLATHLAYHLGQLDYHRRVVTGDQRSIGAIAPGDLPASNVEAPLDSR
jgi:uncharacterized damage-inducible protein DinB